MVQITQHPSSVSFAGNPVSLMAKSLLSSKTFLKVCAEVTIEVLQKHSTISKHTRQLSVPTNGGGQTVVFNLSDMLRSALSRVSVERNPTLAGGVAVSTGGYVKYSVKLWDEYLDDYSEIISSKNEAVTSGERVAIPGSFTELLRLSAPEDTATYLGDVCKLSSKPDFEIVPLGGKITVPIYSSANRSLGSFLDSTSAGSPFDTHSLYANETSWHTYTIPDKAGEGVHSLVWDRSDVPPVFFYAVPQHPFVSYFEFVNRFGAVESIYTYGRRSLKSTVKQERQAVRRDMSFRPTSGYIKRTLQEEQTLTLSTGPVSREWAKWFTSEFFCADKAWMYSQEAGTMVPVIIEGVDETVVYNESEAQVLDLPFSVTLCING